MSEYPGMPGMIFVGVSIFLAGVVLRNWHTRRACMLIGGIATGLGIMTYVAAAQSESIGSGLFIAALAVALVVYLIGDRRLTRAGIRNGSINVDKHRKGIRYILVSGLVLLVVMPLGYYVFDLTWLRIYRDFGPILLVLGGWELLSMRGQAPPSPQLESDPT